MQFIIIGGNNMSNEPIFSVLTGKPSALDFISTSTGRESNPYAINSNDNLITVYSNGNSTSISGFATTVVLSLEGSGTLSQSSNMFSILASPTNLGGGTLDKDGYYTYSAGQSLSPGKYYASINRFGFASRTISYSGTRITAQSYRTFPTYTPQSILQREIPGWLFTSEVSGLTYSESLNRIDYRIYSNTSEGYLTFDLLQDSDVTFYASVGTQHYQASVLYVDRRPLRSLSLNGNTANNWTLYKDGYYYNNTLVSPGNYNQTIVLKSGTYQIRLKTDGNYGAVSDTAYVLANPL